MPPALRAQSWRLAEQLRDGFVTEIVEQLAERLHARFGSDAIIEIPLLEVRWDGGEQTVTDFEYARKLGDGLADELLSEYDGSEPARAHAASTAGPTNAGAMRVYRDRAHKSAVIVTELAKQQRQAATLTRQATIEQEWRTLCAQGGDAVETGVRYIGELGGAAEVAEALDNAMLEAAIRVIPLSRWSEPMRGLVAERLRETTPAAPGEADAREAAKRHVSPADRPDSAAGPGDDRAPAAAIQTQRTPPADDEQVRETDAPTGPALEKPASKEPPSREREQESSSAAPVPEHGGAITPGDDTVEGLPRERGGGSPALADDDTPGNALPMPADTRHAAMRDVAATQLAGLAYLLNLALRIELPEILWCCGIDERRFLCDVFRAVAGPDSGHDPLMQTLFGAQYARTTNDQSQAVPEWARVEVAQMTRARLNREGEAADEPKLDSPRDETASWQALVDTVAHLLTGAFLRAVHAPDDAEIGAYLRLEGDVVTDADETITIRLPMHSIDINVRRVALDANPGYLPWAGVTLRIDFADDSESQPGN